VVPAKQSTGAQLYTLANGVSVARLAPGAEFTSQDIELTVPTNAPNSVVLKLEIDNVHFHYGYADAIAINGLACERAINLVNTPYDARITNVSPASALGDTNFVITGQALDRVTTNGAARVAVKWVVSLRGFERTYNLLTDSSGNFAYTFTPGIGECGLYTAWAVHPDVLDKPAQAQFAIHRVFVVPTEFNVNSPQNYPRTLTVAVQPSEALTLTNLHLWLDPADQPAGGIPAGLRIQTNAPISVVPGNQTALLPITLQADNTVSNPGSFVMSVRSADGVGAGSFRTWTKIPVSYAFSAARPVLNWSPSYIDTGVAISNTVTETLTLSNVGLADMEQVQLTLLTTNGLPVPAWVMLNSSTNLGTLLCPSSLSPSSPQSLSPSVPLSLSPSAPLSLSASVPLCLSFSPTNGVTAGYYRFKLRVTAANAATTDINIDIAVNDSGKGGALFKVTDLYYGYQGNTGVNGALVQLIKQEGVILTTNLTTDALGEAWFQNVPVGRYKYRVTANQHDGVTGTLWIRPGVTPNQEVWLKCNLVTVEWSVNPIPIEDCYNIVLSATFNTDVPAPVVVTEPMSFSLPDMKAGDVFNGEFTIGNYGLLTASNLTFVVPPSDEHFRVELSGAATNQTVLAAHETRRVSYRVTCLTALDGSGGGGCYTWTLCVPIRYQFSAACGKITDAETYFCLNRTYGSCPGGSAGVIPPLGGPTGGDPYNPNPNGGTPGNPYNPGGGGGGGGPAPAPQPLGDEGCLKETPVCFPDECGSGCSGRQEVVGSSSVDLITRRFVEQLDDLSVKVMGGYVSFERTYTTNRWVFNPAWENLAFDYTMSRGDVSGSIIPCYGAECFSAIKYAGIRFPAAGPMATVFRYDVDHQIYQTVSGYRFEGPGGRWKNYNSDGRLLSFGDRNGTLALMMYDSTTNLLVGVQDRFTNQVLWIEHDTNGWTTAVADAATGGRRVSYQYATNGLLTNAVNVLGQNTEFEYDSKGKITTVTRPDGRVTQIAYNSYDHVSAVTRTNGFAKTFEYGYDDYKQQYYALVKTATGKVTEKWFDKSGQLILTALNGRVIQDSAKPVGKYDPTYEYDSRSNITAIIYPDGARVTREYNGPNGEMTQEINEAGVVARFAFDTAGNLTNKIEAAGTDCERMTRLTYDAFGNLLCYVPHYLTRAVLD